MARLLGLLGLLALGVIGGLAAQPSAKPDDTGKPTALPEGARFRFKSGGIQLGENITAASLALDGKALVYAGAQPGISVLDLVTGKALYRIENDAQESPTLGLLTFSPDGKKIAYAGMRSIVVTENRSDAGAQKSIQLPDGEPLRVQTLALSSDAKIVAAGVGQGGAARKQFGMVWEADTGKLLVKLETLQNASAAVALSPDGKTLATWGKHFARMIGEDMTAGQVVQLWDVATGKEKPRIKMEKANVSALAFAPDNQTLAVASGLSLFQLFDVASAKEQRRFSGRRGIVNLLQFSPDGKTLVAGGFDGGVQAWQTAGGQRLELAPSPKSRLLSFAFPGDGRILALGLQGQALSWWDAVTGQAQNATEAHTGPILSLTYGRDGKTLLTASNDAKLCRWDMVTGKLQRSFMLVDEDTQRLASAGVRLTTLLLSPDARFAATSNIYSPNSLRLWNLATAQVVCDFEASRPVNSFALAFTPGGDRLMSTTAKAIEVWETETGQEKSKLDFQIAGGPGGGGAARLAISPDGKLLSIAQAAPDPDTNQLVMRVLLLDAETGKELQTFDGATVFQNGGAAFSPDSKVLAMPAVGRSIALMRTATGKEWRRLGNADVTELVSVITFSPDSRTVAMAVAPAQAPGAPSIGNQPATIEVWELSSGKLRSQYRGHVGAVNCLAYSPDGSTMSSGGADAAVLVWDLYAAPDAIKLAANDFDDAWGKLAFDDGAVAFKALRQMVASAASSVESLKKKLKPAQAQAVVLKDVEKHVADLDSDTFETRSQAFRELEKVGGSAEPALKKARATKTSLEMQRRLDDLLDRIDRNTLTSEELQGARAVEALERIGTPDARGLLQDLARGAPAARLTGEALRALARLNKK